MLTANEQLRDALIRRQIYLHKYSAGLAGEVQKLLDKTEADVRDQIERRLATLTGADGTLKDFSSATLSRLNVLRNALAKVRADAFDQARDMWDADMQQLARDEAEFLNTNLNSVSPVQLDTVLPDPIQLAAIVTTQPMQGRLLSDWADSLQQADLDRIMDAIHVGMAQGETTDRIVRSVLGTQSMDGADGVVQLTRANAASITQTAISTIAGEARAAFVDANSDVISDELFVATLDAHTTPECQALDGEQFPVGEGPQPPLHWNCRSVRVPLLDGSVIGNRPATSVTAEELDGLTREERMARVLELTGQVPAATTYQEWLAGQSAAFQDRVLGPTRGRAFRDGAPLKRFVNRSGDVLTLDQLRAAGIVDE